jgi:L-glutamine-phosphate cytidylyltransferase
MMESSPKALIVAAGKGSRLRTYTLDMPKCMLDFGGKTLLQRQLDVYRSCGVTDISLIRGYCGEKICYSGIRYYENPDYERNNILNSLFCAEPEISGNLLVSYSDILFEKHVVDSLIQSEHDISIVVDVSWSDYYEGRSEHPASEAESVIFDSNGTAARIGKIFAEENVVSGEFIGMMKLTPNGAELFKQRFHEAKARYWGKPFQRATTFEKAYLTDLLQEIAQSGIPIHCVTIRRGWREIDTVQDYKKALAELGQ